MSRDSIDKWLEAMEFEIFRLSPEHGLLSTELLELRIKQLESMPVTEVASNDLLERIHQLECLKQDLQSLRTLGAWHRKAKQLQDENRGINYGPKGIKLFEEFDTLFEKIRIKQREQQWHLASLSQLWPHADHARKRQMVKLFVTYNDRRLRVGAVNSLLTVPLRIARWAVRKKNRLRGL